MTRSLAAAAAVFVLVGPAAAQPQQPKAADPHHGHGEHFLKCAKECAACQVACDSCAAHCARMVADGKKDHLVTLRTCQDCATVCAAAACVSARGGPFADLICTACADACKRCGVECDKFASDPHMKACADACKKCEAACRDMLGMVGKQ